MDASQFDRLTTTLATTGTRRGLLRLLAALPVAGAHAVLLEPETDAKDRRKRRKKRNKRHAGDDKKNRTGKRKGKRKNRDRRKPPGTPALEPVVAPPRCGPEPATQTCAGTCGRVPNNCGTPVECGPCTCATGCPPCQRCHPDTGVCVPLDNDTPCNDNDACTRTDTCQNGVCMGSNPVVCTPLDACHVAGTCDPATGVCSHPNAPNRTVCPGSDTTTSVCCNGTCWDGCCDGNGNPSSCLAFTTSETTTGGIAEPGGLVGVEAADAKCQRLASAASRPGTYQAWLSTEGAGGVSPATRFRHSAQPYILVNGTPIASNWATLTDGSIDAPLNVTETGTVLGDRQLAWTNTQPNGTPGGPNPGSHCDNWTNATTKPIGNVGMSDTTTSAWTAGSLNPCSTDQFGTTGLRLYCFQQD